MGRLSKRRIAGLAYHHGFWRTTAWLMPGSTLMDRLCRSVALKNLGQANEANSLVDSTLAELPTARGRHGLLNMALDVLISLGRYRDALALEPAKEVLRDVYWVMAQSNLAEAEYCQGLSDQASARLRNPALDGPSDGLSRSSLALQRAWLAVQLGDSASALWQVGLVSAADCPRSYRAEWYFTAAAAHSLAGHPDDADAALDAGARLALRSSSERNALALRGFLMRARGKMAEAEHWLGKAAAHPWHGQGGGALLAWGDVLHELGREAEAHGAWNRAVTQDPESEAAGHAAQRPLPLPPPPR